MSKFKTLTEYKEHYYPNRVENERKMDNAPSFDGVHIHGTRLNKESRKKIVDEIKRVHTSN